ncbi:MAG: hypothetical protein HN413_03340 [Chloroflexi bacterium]|jgi:hypothetical protein|nr:hypothetical protein [Chloroflexota bacterium]
MTSNEPRCIQCDRTDAEVPLIALRSQGVETWICPQHLPLLIHKPQTLVGKMPGAENLSAGDHD